MRRLLYCLVGSTLLHGVLLWVPFPMSAGGAADAPPRPLRVRLVAEAPPKATEPRGQPRRPDEKLQATASKPAPSNERSSVATRSRPGAAKVMAMAPKPAVTSSRRTTLAVKKPAKLRRTDPESPATRTPATAEEPVETVDAAGMPAPVQKTLGGVGSDATAATSTRLARRVTPEASAVRQAAAAPGLTPARYARTVEPRYPRKARRAGWEGTAVLKVLVNADGAPGRVTVDRTSGFDILDSAAVKAVEHWRFHPARRGADAESSWVRVPVAFRLKEDSR